jgi:hypothetical protein
VFLRSTIDGTHRSRRSGRPAGAGVPSGPTVDETIDDFLEAVDDGSARDRYGRAFTRQRVRELRWYLHGHVGHALGSMRLDDVRRSDVEGLVFDLGLAGLAHDRLGPLSQSVRALYDYADERGLVEHNPAHRVGIPDEDEIRRAATVHGSALDPALRRTTLDHVISTALRATTLAFLIAAPIYLGESL